MAVPSLKSIPDDANLETVILTYNKLIAELEWLFGGAIDFRNIKARGITTDTLNAGAVVTDKIAAGAVTADKMTVNELSAITANMGTITAGEIIGGSIKSNSTIEVTTEAYVGNRLEVGFGSEEAKYIVVGSAFLKHEDGVLTIVCPAEIQIQSLGTINFSSLTGSVTIGSGNLATHESRISSLESRVTALEAP